MDINIPSLDNARKDIRSKINEGYAKMGKLIEQGMVDPLYPENPGVDAAQVAAGTPDKTVTVNTELLRDLLNWATQAEAGAIDSVVAKAEELGLAGPMGPEKLIDLTGAAEASLADQGAGEPLMPGTEVPAVGTQTTPGQPIPAGPVGPLSPVMASFLRKGKKVSEDHMIPGVKPEDEPITNPGQMKKSIGKSGISGLPLGDRLNKGNDGKMHEDDIIDSDHEVITTPGQMGKKNPGIRPDGGQDPAGLPLASPINKGNTGIDENGLNGDDSDAAEIGDELDAEGGAESGLGVAPGGEEMTIGGDVDAGADGAMGDVEDSISSVMGMGIDEPVVGGGPEVPPAAPQGGMVQQMSDMQARIAELEAIIKGGAASAAIPAVPAVPAMGGEIEEPEVDLDAAGFGAEEGEEVADDLGAEEGEEVADDLGAEEDEEDEEGEEKSTNPFAKKSDAAEDDDAETDADDTEEKEEK